MNNHITKNLVLPVRLLYCFTFIFSSLSLSNCSQRQTPKCLFLSVREATQADFVCEQKSNISFVT